MAGSPIKRARREGIPIPNLGGRLSRAERVRLDSEPVQADTELAAVAKQVLRNVALRGHNERNCVAAAAALGQLTRPQEMKHSVAFEGFSPEDIEKLTVQARLVVDGEPAK